MRSNVKLDEMKDLLLLGGSCLDSDGCDGSASLEEV